MKRALALLVLAALAAASAPAFGDDGCDAPCVRVVVEGRAVESSNGRFVGGFARGLPGSLVARLKRTGLTRVVPLRTIDAAIVGGPAGWGSAWGWGEVDAFQAAKRALHSR